MHFYKNGNYTVCIMNDGTKIRRTEDDEFIPAFSENMDVTLTEKCKCGCRFCYLGCTPNGKHADLFKYKNIIDSLHPYTELAMNGNDLDHPQLEEFLMMLKEKKVFGNITVNLNQFIENKDKLRKWTDAKLVHGLGISWNNDTVYKMNDTEVAELIKDIQSFPNAVIHTINGIWNQLDREIMKNHNLKVLILGYKKLERGMSWYSKMQSDVELKKACLYNDLEKIIKEGWFKVVSFDNLAIEQLDVKRLLSEDKWEEFYMGDDGHYTFYIDLVEGKFAKNSLSQVKYDIGDMTVDEMFQHILKNN